MGVGGGGVVRIKQEQNLCKSITLENKFLHLVNAKKFHLMSYKPDGVRK